MQALFRAGVNTFTASYALRGTGDFTDLERYRAGFFTGSTGNTLFLFPVDLHKAEPVEPAVDRAQRAQILAERPKNFHGKNYNKK